MGKLYLHALIPLLLATRGTLAVPDPTHGERIVVERGVTDGVREGVTDGVTEGVTEGVLEASVLANWPADQETNDVSDRWHDTDAYDGDDGDDADDGDAEDHSTGIPREDMPPVAPMIPTGCHPAMDLISSDPRFSIFRAAIEETGLVRTRSTQQVPSVCRLDKTKLTAPPVFPHHPGLGIRKPPPPRDRLSSDERCDKEHLRDRRGDRCVGPFSRPAAHRVRSTGTTDSGACTSNVQSRV